MKKAIFYLLLLPLIFFSCKKSEKMPGTVITSGKKYNVNFNVSGFTQTIVNSIGKKKGISALRTDEDSLAASSDSVNLLYYFVFNSAGTLVNEITKTATATGFGPISDQLAAGTYKIAFAAGKTGLIATNPTQVIGGLSFPLGAIYYTPDTPYVWKDTFIDTLSLTVSGADTTVNVNMTRLVAELEVNINDAIPSNAAKIVLNYNGEYAAYELKQWNYFNGPIPQTRTYTLASVIGTTNYQMYNIVLNTKIPLTVKISAYDTSNNLIGNAVVDSVICVPNEKTILSGNLFGNNSSFQVSLNNTWDPNPFITIDY